MASSPPSAGSAPSCQKDKCDLDAYVKIKDGKLLYGTIDEKAIGSFKGKILDKIARDYGSDERASSWTTSPGSPSAPSWSKGSPPASTTRTSRRKRQRQIEDVLHEAHRQGRRARRRLPQGRARADARTQSMEETLEVEVMKVLGRARDEAGQIAGRHLGLENAAVIMARPEPGVPCLTCRRWPVASGSRPSEASGCPGDTGTAPCRTSRQGDLGAQGARVRHQLLQVRADPDRVLLPLHGWSRRTGRYRRPDSRSGYMQRRLINALEDLKLKQDGTVRNTADSIIQFEYGEDGVDPCRSVQGEAIDIDDILVEVLGDEAELLSSASRTRRSAGMPPSRRT